MLVDIAIKLCQSIYFAMNKLLSCILTCGLLLFCAVAQAKPAPFKFVLYYPQVPPYMYQQEQQKDVKGLIPALINEFFAEQGIKLSYVIDNRKGAEHRLYSGDVDAMLLAKPWSEHPEQLLFSEPVIMHRDYLFATQAFSDNSQPDDWLSNAKICTRQYYVYEALDPYFAKGATRLDSSSEAAQMRMLQSGRCDYAYMNEHVAQWLAKNQFPQLKLYRSPVSFGNVGLTIAMHKKWQDLLPKLNAFLQKHQENGRIEQLLQAEIQ